jgi:hypothetical protein
LKPTTAACNKAGAAGIKDYRCIETFPTSMPSVESILYIYLPCEYLPRLNRIVLLSLAAIVRCATVLPLALVIIISVLDVVFN